MRNEFYEGQFFFASRWDDNGFGNGIEILNLKDDFNIDSGFANGGGKYDCSGNG